MGEEKVKWPVLKSESGCNRPRGNDFCALILIFSYDLLRLVSAPPEVSCQTAITQIFWYLETRIIKSYLCYLYIVSLKKEKRGNIWESLEEVMLGLAHLSMIVLPFCTQVPLCIDSSNFAVIETGFRKYSIRKCIVQHQPGRRILFLEGQED